ncbi:NADH-ubiquinone oxidoreductase [Chondrus crispus]|uniref:NADH-ubiquinone oxidoreductase n=1 Tax=Chondrus crispus TaxID=2769 RepID=R7Q7T4_CHOCR|nr:NADH-ubiquinone oxidoreductase [Chondrus crispus]CDF33888.1 NADH-ubiquinone oxidoreductase [Chondrus crispus]|eukprot:XP_005713707.1 NADH-ubiquinone oxidoreductase [Chondrus crispus]
MTHQLVGHTSDCASNLTEYLSAAPLVHNQLSHFHAISCKPVFDLLCDSPVPLLICRAFAATSRTSRSMTYPINPPTHQVITRDPSFGQVMSAFRAGDWQNLALATGISMPFGYWAGRPIVMRPSMYAAATIGALFGLSLGFQSSFARLTGYKENALEVAKYSPSQSAESTA